MICVDSFSKWVELFPMRTKSSAEVVEVLRMGIVARFGVPVEMRFDRGLEFAGSVKGFCEDLGISRVVISTMHPQANGQVERYVGVVKRSLMVMLNEDGVFHSEWVSYLPACLMGLRFLV